jgi:hypothetical protein
LGRLSRGKESIEESIAMGLKYGSCLDLAASTAILDRAWKGKRVKSGLDSKVVISLRNAMRDDPKEKLSVHVSNQVYGAWAYQ